MSEKKLKIEGMGCAGCVNTVRDALAGVEGVSSAEVDLETAWAKIRYDENKATPEQFLKAVEESGYKASL